MGEGAQRADEGAKNLQYLNIKNVWEKILNLIRGSAILKTLIRPLGTFSHRKKRGGRRDLYIEGMWR